MTQGESPFGRDIRRERERLGDSDGDSMRKREAQCLGERERSLAVMARERGDEGAQIV